MKRKAIKFWISKSEDITAPLKIAHQAIVFKIGDRELPNLNRAIIAVKNRGNMTIKDLHFEIKIEGNHQGFAETVTENRKLKEAVKGTSVSGAFHIDAPYFNPKEMFKVVVFFDGAVSKCTVECRMADVRVKIAHGEYASLKDTVRETFSDPDRLVASVVLALAGAIAAAAVVPLLPWFKVLLLSMFGGNTNPKYVR